MASKIDVEKIGESKFRVRVIESGSESTHEVTVKSKDYTKFTDGKIEPEELIRRSFEFLLEREPKESILSRFDLSVIGRYFPEYEREIKRRLSTLKINCGILRFDRNVVVRDGIAFAANRLDAQDLEAALVQVLHVFLHGLHGGRVRARAFASARRAGAHPRDRWRSALAPCCAVRSRPARAAGPTGG